MFAPIPQEWYGGEGPGRGRKVGGARGKGIKREELSLTGLLPPSPAAWRAAPRVAPAAPRRAPARCVSPAFRLNLPHGSGTPWRDFSHLLSHFSCDRGPFSRPATPPAPRARGHRGGGSP